VGGLIVPAIMGTPVDPLHHLIFLFGLAFWQFICVYSSMVLAPAWVLEATAGGRVEPDIARPERFAPGLKPFLWLAVYTVYLLGVMVVMGFLNRR
jgi:hypothetical protein